MRPVRFRGPRHTATAALLVITVAVLAALVAGCGGGPPLAPSNPPPLPRYTTLAQLGAATGAQMKADRTTKITVNAGTSGGSVQASTIGNGAISFDPAGTSMAITERVQAPGASKPVELTLVVLPDQAYVKPPPEAGYRLPAGKSWLRIRPNSPDQASQQFGQLVQSVRANADPTRSFTQFGDAASIVQSVEETLDGVRAVRYQIRVDVAKAASQERDPALKQELQQSASSGMSTVDSSLWLDDRNRPLRVLLQQVLPAGQGTYTVDARYRDWGQPVQITSPPADQVASG
jgi:hypothetical protein